MSNSFTSLSYHIVFSTKYRRPLITESIAPKLHSYVAGIIRSEKSQPLEIGGVEDHVHILTGIHPTIAVSDMVRTIKANASRWFNAEHSRDVRFEWQDGYGAFTVSQSQVEGVREYVKNQREHHHQMTFREEYLSLLRKHGVKFDLKYVFDEEHLA